MHIKIVTKKNDYISIELFNNFKKIVIELGIDATVEKVDSACMSHIYGPLKPGTVLINNCLVPANFNMTLGEIKNIIIASYKFPEMYLHNNLDKINFI